MTVQQSSRAASAEHSAALEKIGRISSEHAAIALAQLIGLPVGIRIVRILRLDMLEVAKIVESPQDIVVTVCFDVYGPKPGKSVLLFPRAAACQLVDVACHRRVGQTLLLDENACSALREIANIMVGSVMSAIREQVDVPLIHSVPRLAVDQVGATLSAVLSVAAEESEGPLLVIESQLEVQQVSGRCSLFMINGSWI